MTSERSLRSRGVTLVEVIFSMGVVLIGLLGVMSILPLAGNRAKDAVGLSVASALADNVMEEMLAQRWLSSGRLAMFDDNGDLIPFDGSRPFCIDPAFVSIGGRQNPGNFYDTRFFPFYKENHDPTLDPSAPYFVDALGETPLRMLRVGILQRSSSLGGPLTLLTRDQALRVADSPDDLLIERPKARTDNPFMLGVRATRLNPDPNSSLDLPYGGRFGSGDFSWIATVSPNASPEYVTVSVAVIRNRQRGFSVPVTALNPEQNATDERLATISYTSGFRGGAGGSVELNGAKNTVSRLRVGDWLMLERAGGTAIVVNRWYRVAAVEREVQTMDVPRNQIGINSQSLNLRTIWRRRVYLDGPDFAFNNLFNPLNQTQTTSTLAVMVEGVVSVTEHVVRLRDL